MVEFNLLPWRVRKLQYEKMLLIKIIAGSVILIMIAWFILHLLLINAIQNMQYKINQLDMQLEPYFALEHFQLQQKKTTASFQVTMKQQKIIFDLMNALSAQKQQDICFTEITTLNHESQFVGKIMNGANLFAFIKSWNATNLFSEIKIQTLERAGDNQINFKMKAELSS